MVTFRLISIGLSGALTDTQPPSASAPSAAAAFTLLAFIASLLLGGGWLDRRVARRGLCLLLLFLGRTNLGDDPRNVLQRHRQDVGNHGARVAEALGGGDQRAGRPLDRDIELERKLAGDASKQLRRSGLAEA